MSEPVYSFVFDRTSSLEAFKQIGLTPMMLAILARVTPEQDWNGCLVYLGDTPLEPVKTACVGTRGPAAEPVQLELLEAFEQAGITVLGVYEGGPEVKEAIAEAQDGKWVTATRA